MKVLQLIQKPQLRGAEMFASQLSNHLLEQGHDVKMVCLFSGSATLPFLGEVMVLNRPSNKRFVDFEGWRQLAHIIETFQPDIIQANAGDTLKFSVFSKLFFRWKAPIVFRNANKVSDFINSTSKLLFNKFLVSQVRQVISVSELCRQDFVKTYSFYPPKTITIPIGIDIRPVEKELPPDVRKIFMSDKVLLHAASFVPEKNHEGLLRILQAVQRAGSKVQLVLIGDGKLRPVVEQQIKALGLSNNVHVLGYRQDVLSLMQHAHAFLLPSKIEGLPGVILEAMYSNAPVIAYDVGGISEVVKDGVTGCLVKAGDESAFVNAVLKMLTMPAAERKQMIDSAYQLVINDYDNKIIAQRFLKVYEALIS